MQKLFTRVSSIHFTHGSPMHSVLAAIEMNPHIWLQELADALGTYREYLQEYTRYAANVGWVHRGEPEGRRIPMTLTEAGKAALEEMDQQDQYDTKIQTLCCIYVKPGITALDCIKTLSNTGFKVNYKHFETLANEGLIKHEGRSLFCTKAGEDVLREALAPLK